MNNFTQSVVASSTTADIAYYVCIVSFFVAGGVAIYLLLDKIKQHNVAPTKAKASKPKRSVAKKPVATKKAAPAKSASKKVSTKKTTAKATAKKSTRKPSSSTKKK